MPKSRTISTRWKDWALTPGEFWWSYVALSTFMGSIAGLGLHLWVLDGLWRTVGLWILIVLACVTETILFCRARKVPTVWWWFWFHTYIVVGVIGWEVASSVVSAIWGV
jgi:hypothetical protein